MSRLESAITDYQFVTSKWCQTQEKIAYTPPTEYLFPDQKRKAKVINKMKPNIAKLDIKPEDVGFVIT